MEKIIRPLSLIIGDDGECIDTLIQVHSSYHQEYILDATANQCVMWKKSVYKPHIRLDIDVNQTPSVCGNYDSLPFKNDSFTLIAFDPPHLPNTGDSENSSKIFKKRYGINQQNPYGHADNIVSGFEPFLIEAKRVLKPHGLILAKIADIIHNHRYQFQHVDFINAAQRLGLTVCDLMIKSAPQAGRLNSSKWENVYHLRKNHVYWIAIRNSNRCERLKNKLYLE